MKPFGQANGSIYLISHVYPMPINEHDLSCYIITSRLKKLPHRQKCKRNYIPAYMNGKSK